jgi:DNA (cytosine-5)-methyltransferase 1
VERSAEREEVREVKVIERRVIHDTGGQFSSGDVTDKPCPAITVGHHGGGPHILKIHERVVESRPPRTQPLKDSMNKPDYHLPSMADVARARGSAGLTAVSTFAGCGGSCLGFEMAGFEMLWANEFVPAAQDTYRANHPHTPLDGRDIREVKPEEILEAIGLAKGELDVLNGSPPCASFSSAGKRSEHWGKVKAYSDTKQRTDDLFFEFVRLLSGLQPRAFVAENVAGLTRGVAIGYFKEIMRALDGAGYAVKCKVLDAQWLGVPQSRSRAIFVGVRKDLGEEPEHPKPLGYRYTLREVLPGLMRARCLNTGSHFSPVDVTDRPAGAILASEPHKHVIERVVHDTSGLYGAGDITDRPCPTVTVGINSVNSQHFEKPVRGPEWLPEGCVSLHREWETLRPGESSEKYFSMVRSDPDKPSPTILGTHGRYAIACPTVPHEPRRFTIPELRVVCGFPADFVLTGTYAQQWERLGRAVPPPMMRAVATVLRDGLFTRLGRTRAGFTEAA